LKEEIFVSSKRIINILEEANQFLEFSKEREQNLIEINNNEQSRLYPNNTLEEISLIGTESEVISSKARIFNTLPGFELWSSTQVCQPTLDNKEDVSSRVEKDDADLYPKYQKRQNNVQLNNPIVRENQYENQVLPNNTDIYRVEKKIGIFEPNENNEEHEEEILNTETEGSYDLQKSNQMSEIKEQLQ
jgi:hypothetical protein